MLYTKETMRDTAMKLYKRQNSRSPLPKDMELYKRENRLDSSATRKDVTTVESPPAVPHVRSRSPSPTAPAPHRRQNGPALSVRAPPAQPVVISATTDRYQRRNAPALDQAHMDQRQQEKYAGVPAQPFAISAATDMYQRRNVPASPQAHTDQRPQEKQAAVSSPVRAPPVLCDLPTAFAPSPVVSSGKNIGEAVAHHKLLPVVSPIPILSTEAPAPAAASPGGGKQRQLLRNSPPKLSSLCR